MKNLLFALGLICSFSAFSQDYKTAIGVRAGLANGLTVKHFISSDRAVEGILSTRWSGFNITGLYEIHANAFNDSHWNWYYGFGAHLGSFDGNDSWGDDGVNYTIIGVDGIIGLEYRIDDIPINLSLDWKPALNLIGYTGFWADGFAISVRYEL
jgi:hypothetical protein